MGAAIWQYMWLLDKITKIDDDGFGWVLGGKPINLEDIAGSKSKVTISRNLGRLEREGYIKMIHTPYGIVVKVTKAKKRFSKNDNPVEGKRFNNNDKPRNENDKPRFNNDKPNKIRQLDKTDDTSGDAADALLIKVIKAFEEVDPKNKTYYANKTQRSSAAYLVAEYGLEEVLKRVSVLPKTNKIRYFPTINSPNELKEKWVKLQDAVTKMREEKITKQTPNYII